jgi:hypothetical protein
VAAAAVAAVRPHLVSEDPDVASRALDALVTTGLDPARAEAARLAIIDALADAGTGAADALRARLRDDQNPRIRRAVEDAAGPAGVAGASQIEAVAADPGSDPLAVQRLIGEAGSQGGLAALHQLVLALGHRERTAATDAERAGWTLALGAAHHALAARGWPGSTCAMPSSARRPSVSANWSPRPRPSAMPRAWRRSPRRGPAARDRRGPGSPPRSARSWRAKASPTGTRP